jgi:hypothetical protein
LSATKTKSEAEAGVIGCLTSDLKKLINYFYDLWITGSSTIFIKQQSRQILATQQNTQIPPNNPNTIRIHSLFSVISTVTFFGTSIDSSIGI